MKLVISIPVHEKPDVITDQINNLKKYIDHPIIVLHISKSFFNKYSLCTLEHIENVYINPVNLETAWGNIFLTHVSNFFFIREIMEFDYFLIQASNDMFLRPGIEDYIRNYKAGFCRRMVLQEFSMWWPGRAAWNDQQLKKIMNIVGQRRIIATQIEGTFFRYDIAEQIMRIIRDNYVLDKKSEIYPREEFYFSTIASALVDWNQVGYPSTYSEVHVFDRLLWRVRSITRAIYFGCRLNFLVRENFYYRFEDIYNDIFFKSRLYRIRKKTVRKIKGGDQKFIRKNSVLNDYPGFFQLYDAGHMYAIKRVTRDYNDRIRTYIRAI